jgi:hypothetical protein
MINLKKGFKIFLFFSMPVTELKLWAVAITQLFPKERLSDWYNAKSSGSPGRLIYHYNYLKPSKVKVMSIRVQKKTPISRMAMVKKTPVAKISPLQNTADDQQIEEEAMEVDDNVEMSYSIDTFTAGSNDPIIILEDVNSIEESLINWRVTLSTRMAFRRKTDVKQYLEEYPILKQRHGHKYVSQEKSFLQICMD